MTREEAKEVFLNRGFIDGIYNGDKWREACIVISKWLEQEPTTKNDLGVDCIDRQATLDAIIKRLGVKNETYLLEAERVIYQQILVMPSVTPQERKGHWEQYGYSWEDKFKCSECGKEQPKILCGEKIIGHWSDYCPNCGCRMVEPQESEDKE